MIKCYSEQAAESLATDNGMLYGRSIFDGCYYLGTRAQLENVGCVSSEIKAAPVSEAEIDDVVEFVTK